jgi:hypothetical protein
MALMTGDWVGKIIGTNTGDIFFEAVELEDKLSGIIRVNDPIYGTSVFSVAGSRNGNNANIKMDPIANDSSQIKMHTAFFNGRMIKVEVPTQHLGHVTASGTFKNDNRIEGKWHSSIGTGGTFWMSRPETSIKSNDNFSGEQIDNITFIMMSISDAHPEFEDTLLAIKRASESHGIGAERVDEIEHSGRITDLILERIKKSRFLVCNITTERPNVYYELGYAHGLKRNVILVAKQGTIAHFDIKDYNIIFYKNFADLETRVARRIGEALGKSVEE